jgi:hypothetical protein
MLRGVIRGVIRGAVTGVMVVSFVNLVGMCATSIGAAQRGR